MATQSQLPGQLRGQPLTRRERLVLSILDENVTLTEIAAQLEVTRNTVKSHVRSLYKKLGVSTRTAAADQARALGLR
jgi:LuxR family transcriptional regulator, transcriptional regulator of spore coat protein